jgi:hypothetical protein
MLVPRHAVSWERGGCEDELIRGELSVALAGIADFVFVRRGCRRLYIPPAKTGSEQFYTATRMKPSGCQRSRNLHVESDRRAKNCAKRMIPQNLVTALWQLLTGFCYPFISRDH